MKKLEKIIKKAALKHVTKKKVDNRVKPGLTPEIKEAIKKRNQLRKTVATNRKEWVEACNDVREMIKENREKNWKEYVEKLDMSTNPSLVWRTIHSMEGKFPAKVKNEVLTINGVALADDINKAEAFEKTYKRFSQLPVKKSDRTIRRRVRKRIKRRPTAEEECEQALTMEELERVIQEAGNNKVSGDDDLPYEVIKYLGKKAKGMILYIFNL